MDYRTSTTDDGSLAFVGIDARTEIVDFEKNYSHLEIFLPIFTKKSQKA